MARGLVGATCGYVRTERAADARKADASRGWVQVHLGRHPRGGGREALEVAVDVTPQP